MGLKTGRRLKIWEITDKGNYASVRCSTSRKSKDSDEYTTDWSGYVNFVGKAYELLKSSVNDGGAVRAGDFEVTSRYDKEKGKEYVNYAMFSFELFDNTTSAPVPKATEAPAEEEVSPEDDPF